MEIVTQQFCVEYQSHSLIEFLLGDHRNLGWLDAYAGQVCDPPPDIAEVPMERHASAA
jgi:hypothetical protein